MAAWFILCSALLQAKRGKAKVRWEICVSVSDNYDSIYSTLFAFLRLTLVCETASE